MSENNKTTITRGNHPQDRDPEQPTKIREQKNRIVKDDEIPVNNSFPMGYNNSLSDEPTAPPKRKHQQNKDIISQEVKMNLNKQKQLADCLEEIQKSRAPPSASEQFDRFNYAEANGVASRVAPYYWRPVPPALKKPYGMDRYNVRPGWKSSPPSPPHG